MLTKIVLVNFYFVTVNPCVFAATENDHGDTNKINVNNLKLEIFFLYSHFCRHKLLVVTTKCFYSVVGNISFLPVQL